MSQFPSLFFTVDIRHAFDLSAVMRSHGVKVYPISGKTPDDEEKRFLRLFQDGHIDGLASCGVLQEGFDAPAAMGAFLCRPTKSGLLYRQMVGRVLRPFPAPQGDRYYQQECLASMLEHVQSGITAQLIVLPTGTGKTYVAAHTPGQVIQKWKNGRTRGRTLFLVHRDNLVTQAADTFRHWTDLTVGVEKGGGCYAGDADVVVASVQTLGPAKADGEAESGATWEYNRRLRSFNPDRFDTVVVDESHHAPKGIFYLNIMRYFGVLKGESNRDPEKLLACITATPNRADNTGMEVICDKIVYNYALDQAIKDGFLAPINAYRAETEVDISAVKTTHGDFNVPDLESAINTPERNTIIARKYLEIRDKIQPDIQPGHKPYACVVDFVDIAGRHHLITIPTLFGLRETFDAKGKNIVEQVEEIEKIEAEHPGLDLRNAPNLEALKTSLHKLDLLKPPETPEEIRKISPFTWLKEGEGAYHLGLMDGSMISIRENTLGACEIYRHVKGVRTKLHTARTIQEAVAQAEKEIPEQERKVLSAEASWRREPPTEKQCWRIFALDKKMKGQFGTVSALHEFCLARFKGGDTTYSRGGMSSRIDALQVSHR